jgi:hypothetical protein
MINASTYFPGAANGNGDGDYNGDWITIAEVQQAAQHLAFAQMIPGNYVAGSGGPAVIGPGGNVQNSIFASYAAYWPRSDRIWNQYNRKPMLTLSGASNASGWDDYILTVLEAYNIDVKIDDGKPGTGVIIGINETILNSCTNYSYSTLAGTPLDVNTQVYNTSSSTAKCTLYQGLLGNTFYPGR